MKTVNPIKSSRTATFNIGHIASLAKFRLTPQEAALLGPQLETILEFVRQLESVDTKAIEETSQVTGLVNVLREDEVDSTRMLTQEEVLANAPATHNGCIKVKAIFEES